MSEEKQPQEAGQDSKILKTLSPRNIIIPIIIGLGLAAYWLYLDLSNPDFIKNFKNPNYFWLGMAFIALFIRDGFYIYRIRELSRRALSWVGSFYTIILWEFSSAISPSAVGGTAVAAFLLLKEGISFGKSLAYVLVSAIMDNMFFITLGAIVLILDANNFYPNGIFYLEGIDPSWISLLKTTFYTSYSVIAAYTLLMFYGLFYKPTAIKWLFVKITSIGFLKRFQKAAEHQGDELVVASKELKGIEFSYWAKAIISTAFVWISRYAIVNCLLAAFVPTLGLAEHGIIFSRHVILWVVLIIAFTPGGSGIAEGAFLKFYTPFAFGMTGFIAIIWRMITYYPYLIAGVIFLPRWLRRVFVELPKSTPLEK